MLPPYLNKTKNSAPYILIMSSIFCSYLYWQGFYGPLLLDDLANLGGLLSNHLSKNEILAMVISDSGPFGRPVSMLSFIINALSSQNLFYWKLSNFIIHLCCSVLIYQITYKIGSFHHGSAHKYALAIAVIWMIHPLHVSTVLYLVQRMTLLATLFTLASLLTYLIARTHNSNPWFYQILTWCVFFPLAVLSKETALLIPAYILLLELFIINKNINNKTLTFIFFSIVSIVTAVFFYKMQWVLGGYRLRDFSFLERILTEPRVISAYIKMILLPVQNTMGFIHDDIVLSKSLFQPFTTFLSILFISSLIYIAFFVRKQHPLISFGILFYFSGHILESTVFALEIMFEHRNHLPSFGLILAAADACRLLFKSFQAKILCVSLIFILFSFVTWQRANTWSNETELYLYMERTHPHSERLAITLSNRAIYNGLYALAREKIQPFNSLGNQIHLNYIDCLEYKTMNREGFKLENKKTFIINNYTTMGLIDLANLGLDEKCDFSDLQFTNELTGILNKASMSKNNRQMLMMYKAHFLWKQNQQDAAIKTLEANYLINPNNPVPLFLACEWAIDHHLSNTINKHCQKSINIANKTPYQYDNLKKGVINKLEKYHLSQQ